MKLIIDKNIICKKVILLKDNDIFDFNIQFNDEIDIRNNIYKGTVTNVLYDISAAFVDIGLNQNAFLDFNDLANKDLDGIKDFKDYIYPGKETFVQVKKIGHGTKGPKVTENISLAKKFSVLLPHENRVYVSKKVTKDEAMVKKIKLAEELIQNDYGVILRTNSKNASLDALQKEIISSIESWKAIERYQYIKPKDPLLYQSNNVVDPLLNDYYSEIESIVTNSSEAYEQLENFNPLKDKVKLIDSVDLIEQFHLTKAFNQLLSPKITLDNGINIDINFTEAMTIIDVNSGDYRGDTNSIFTINAIALKEIAKQLNIRNIGGIIIIDLINLEDINREQELIKKFKGSLDHYKTKFNILGMTQLGLLEMTKKQTENKLTNKLMIDCSECIGGKVLNPKMISDEIVIKLKRIVNNTNGQKLLIQTRKDVIDYLENNEPFQKFIKEHTLDIKYDISNTLEIKHLKI